MSFRTTANYRPWTISHSRGFSLVELMVVISILGVLLSLLIPAVQYARETSRRTACSSNLRNQVLALQNFHDANRLLPFGRNNTAGLDTSWFLEILPYVEQGKLLDSYDRTSLWTTPPHNLAIANQTISLFRCPSSVVKFPGDTDYGGMTGSGITAASLSSAFNNGVMIVNEDGTASNIFLSSITDGTSQTIAIAESSDRLETPGRWISGFSSFSHNNGKVTSNQEGEIFSYHTRGANVAFADGSVRFLTLSTAPYVLGAMCTRNHGETISMDAF